MKLLKLLLLTVSGFSAAAQDNQTELAQPIVAEGKLLYKSEMASWYGTDVFIEGYKDHSAIGGYFSYTDGDSSRCVFFSKTADPVVIGTISFDDTYKVSSADTDLTSRPFSAIEKSLYAIRKAAQAIINSDTLFKGYPDSKLNLIPLITGNEKKVYVLTGPEKNGVIIFGNDYLLTFDKDNNLISRRQLHRNIIPVQFDSKKKNEESTVETMHSHLPETGEFITATDICTLMLYERFTNWKKHIIVSKEFMNIWDCAKDELLVLPMSTIQKINEDQEKRNKKKKDN